MSWRLLTAPVMSQFTRKCTLYLDNDYSRNGLEANFDGVIIVETIKQWSLIHIKMMH